MSGSSSLLRDLLNISARAVKLGERLDDPKLSQTYLKNLEDLD